MIVKTIGRSQENNIVINDDNVSRKHLQIVQDDNDNFSVVDLGSTNGTFVNGKRINGETLIYPGDELRIGGTVLNWQDYFPKKPAIRSSQTQNLPLSQQIGEKRKQRKTWIFIVPGLLLLLIIGAVVLYLNKENKTEMQQHAEESRYRDLEREALTADRDAARTSAEYEEAQKIAAISKSERDQRRADSLKAVFEKSQTEAVRLNNEITKIKDEKNQAEKERAAAEEREKKSNMLKNNAERDKERAEEAEKAAKEAMKKAEDEAKRIKTEAEVERKEYQKTTEEFYKELNKAYKEERLKDACKTLGISTFLKTEEGQYNAIVEEFGKASDNNKRKDIIQKIKTVKKNKKKNSSKTDTTLTDKTK